jgi:hypothetical protein
VQELRFLVMPLIPVEHLATPELESIWALHVAVARAQF